MGSESRNDYDLLKDASLFLRVACHYAPDQHVNDQNLATGEYLKIQGLRTTLRKLAEEIDDKLRSAPSESATPEGMVLVPKEPTRRMLDVWHDTGLGVYTNHPSTRPGVHWSDSEARYVACYKAMLQVAPKPLGPQHALREPKK